MILLVHKCIYKPFSILVDANTNSLLFISSLSSLFLEHPFFLVFSFGIIDARSHLSKRFRLLDCNLGKCCIFLVLFFPLCVFFISSNIYRTLFIRSREIWGGSKLFIAWYKCSICPKFLVTAKSWINFLIDCFECNIKVCLFLNLLIIAFKSLITPKAA